MYINLHTTLASSSWSNKNIPNSNYRQQGCNFVMVNQKSEEFHKIYESTTPRKSIIIIGRVMEDEVRIRTDCQFYAPFKDYNPTDIAVVLGFIRKRLITQGPHRP